MVKRITSIKTAKAANKEVSRLKKKIKAVMKRKDDLKKKKKKSKKKKR